MKRFLMTALITLLVIGGALAPDIQAEDAQPGVLFANVRIFNGTSDEVSTPSHVLVAVNVIKAIFTKPVTIASGTSVMRIQGGGRTLMPGLIDAHVHLMFSTVPLAVLLMSDIGYINMTQQLGVTTNQAKEEPAPSSASPRSGLSAEEFSTLTKYIPGSDSLMTSANGLMAVTGPINDKAGLEAAFKNLGLGSNMVPKMSKIVSVSSATPAVRWRKSSLRAL